MCGIVGFIEQNCQKGPSKKTITNMLAHLKHRGPDRNSFWTDPRFKITLGHTRLSILELSPFGNQPMESHSGRYVIVYNGEIYNHKCIRKILPETQWRGNSDTETLIHAVECWGVEKTLKRLSGMFAFALYDKKLATLTIARDRFGEKPMYYGWQNGTFLFSSELRALEAHPSWQPHLSKDSLNLYTKYSYIPTLDYLAEYF